MTLPRYVVGALGHPSYALTRNMDSYSGSFEKYILWHFLIGVAQSKEFRIVTLYKTILMVFV